MFVVGISGRDVRESVEDFSLVAVVVVCDHVRLDYVMLIHDSVILFWLLFFSLVWLLRT